MGMLFVLDIGVVELCDEYDNVIIIFCWLDGVFSIMMEGVVGWLFCCCVVCVCDFFLFIVLWFWLSLFCVIWWFCLWLLLLWWFGLLYYCWKRLMWDNMWCCCVCMWVFCCCFGVRFWIWWSMVWLMIGVIRCLCVICWVMVLCWIGWCWVLVVLLMSGKNWLNWFRLIWIFKGNGNENFVGFCGICDDYCEFDFCVVFYELWLW